MLGALAACPAGIVTLVASDVHLIEIRQNPHPNRRDFALEVLRLAPYVLSFTEHTAALARAFARANIGGPDALHLAVAVEAGADVFCTTDDKLIRRSARVDTGGVSVVTPLGLAAILNQL